MEAEFARLFKKGRHTVEYRFLKKDGTYCWVNDAQRLIRDRDGQPAEVVGSWSDVSERKRAEEAAAAAQQRVEHLLASSPAVIYSFKATGDYAPTFISRNVKDLLGYDPSEYLDSPDFWRSRVHQKDSERILGEFPRLFAEGHLSIEYRFRKKDGSYCWISDELQLIRSPAGDPQEVVGSWNAFVGAVSAGNPALSIQVNVMGLVNVLEAARALDVKRVVFTSAKGVYGPVTGEYGSPTWKPMSEDLPAKPKRIYNSAKFMGENVCAYYNENMGIETVSLRFASTYGPGKTARHGPMAVMSRIVENPAHGLPFKLEQGGDDKDDFIYNKDSALGIYLATIADKIKSRVFNIGTGTGVTLRDFERVIKKHIPNAQMEIGGGLNFYGFPYPATGVYDISRARAELGYAPRIRSGTRHRRLSGGAQKARRLKKQGTDAQAHRISDAVDQGARSALGNVRAEMEKRGLDCLVLCGWPAMWDFNIANARYLCPIGGNAEHNVLVFPLSGEPTTFIYSPVFTDYWKGAQSWVADVRPRKGSFADSIADRLTELKMTGAKIGIDGLAGPLDPDGWTPHSLYIRAQGSLPGVNLVNLEDMMEKLRV